MILFMQMVFAFVGLAIFTAAGFALGLFEPNMPKEVIKGFTWLGLLFCGLVSWLGTWLWARRRYGRGVIVAPSQPEWPQRDR